MVGDLNKEISRLRTLKKNKGKPDEELHRLAFVNLRVKEFKSNPLFTDKSEMDFAEARFRNYLETNELESMSEIDTLRSLIYNEVFEARIQKQLNKVGSENRDPSDKMTKQLTDIQNQKLSLKVKLGIDNKENEVDELTGLQILKKRFKDYINANKSEFTIICPHGQLMLVRKRVKDFDSMAHPFFVGRWLANYEMLKDVKDGKLSKEDCWRYLSCASQGKEYKPAFGRKYCVDYIDYILNHWAEIMEDFHEK